jgi:predicted nucleic acid-binding Zn ribbon protein
MSEARKCDVCGNHGEPPYSDWWILRPHDGAVRTGQQLPERLDICSQECLNLHVDNLQRERVRFEAVKT